MNISRIIKSAACVALAALTLCSAASCGKKKNVSVATAPTFGHFTKDGYELPYDYKDGYRATMKVPKNTEYVTVSTTPGGNKVVHMRTTESEDAVKKFYEEYFKELVELKAVKKTDQSVAYYDEPARLILFNLNVWFVDGKTNFSIGTQACDKLEDAKLWQKVDGSDKKDDKKSSSDKEKSSSSSKSSSSDKSSSSAKSESSDKSSSSAKSESSDKSSSSAKSESSGKASSSAKSESSKK